MIWLKKIILILCAANLISAAHAYDLSKPADLVEAYVKAVGDISGDESFAYAHVVVMAMIPGQRGKPLFTLEVVGASRFVPIEGGYQLLHREVGLYTDLHTGEIMHVWKNPFIDRDVDVLHIQNDPVNFPVTVEQQSSPIRIQYEELGNKIAFHREILLRYPSTLSRKEYPLNSFADWYEAAELFNNFVDRDDLDNDELTSVPQFGSWTRVGPWLPWMEMGDSPGHLVYNGRSTKLMGGVDEIPPKIRSYMEAHLAKYLGAPEKFEQPNETSWTWFKKRRTNAMGAP